MDTLNKYFLLFDEARISAKAREDLINLFSQDICFVLAGKKKNGLKAWNEFLDGIFQNNLDIKHMHENWVFNSSTKKYTANWVVCGKSKEGKVYIQKGVDIAELDQFGKIKYLENIPDNSQLFEKYK